MNKSSKFENIIDKIETYETLWSLVDLDVKTHKVKKIARLFLMAWNDWPTLNQCTIPDFVNELKFYFGHPISIEKIKARKFNGKNAWQVEAGSSIVELIELASKYFKESNFDKAIEHVLSYYNEEFRQVDFIATLQYFSPENGGRKTAASSGYRPQIKFSFSEMQTSGQQTFINRNTVGPGEKVVAKIKIASSDYFKQTLSEGMEFDFREGTIIIGTGKIDYMVNENLEK